MAKWLAILMAIWQIAFMEIKQWKDDEGDLSAGLEAGHLTVFATKQASGAWVVSFALTSELEDLENAETLTGFGAFLN
jgi:4-hydroxybenzoate polyprenyltransferase